MRERTVIKDATLRKVGTVEDVHRFLAKHAAKPIFPELNQFRTFGGVIPLTVIGASWEHNHLQNFRPLFCANIGTATRIMGSDPQSSISLLDQAPSHPIHLLYSDDRIEKRLSYYFRRAFGEDLIVFHGGGSSWPLLVGHRPPLQQGEDRISATYLERLRSSTVPLQAQGDGMRSFATVILHMLARTTPSILILDEPEAFLHPPQARLLGEFIARERPRDAQLFIATHSPDALSGLLNAAPERLRIIRIQRAGSVSRAKELDKGRAKDITTDPLMKFSAVLSGIFHQRVVVCESDADCMFCSAVLDIPHVHGEQQPDVLFVHAGGKHRIAAIVEALRALDVRVDVVADMDVLNEETVFERLVRALGGAWDEVVANARPLKLAIEQHKPWLTSDEVVKSVEGILAKAPGLGEFPRNLRNEIDAIFRKASPWDAIKDAGRAAIPAGQPTLHYERLQNQCNAFGLWIVPVGQLEGFCKSEGGHGPRWVQAVLEKHDLVAGPELREAREFVTKLWRAPETTPN